MMRSYLSYSPCRFAAFGSKNFNNAILNSQVLPIALSSGVSPYILLAFKTFVVHVEWSAKSCTVSVLSAFSKQLHEEHSIHDWYKLTRL